MDQKCIEEHTSQTPDFSWLFHHPQHKRLVSNSPQCKEQTKYQKNQRSVLYSSEDKQLLWFLEHKTGKRQVSIIKEDGYSKPVSQHPCTFALTNWYVSGMIAPWVISHACPGILYRPKSGSQVSWKLFPSHIWLLACLWPRLIYITQFRFKKE